MKSSGVGLSDLAYFDNMLVADVAARRKKHEFMLRVFDAAVVLGTDAVCGFVGRNPELEMDANLVMFEEVFIPLLQEAKARGLTYRVEQCPMPGWNITDNWHNNIAYAPGPWIALHRICERHGVGDQFRIHYDPSHAILMGQDTRSMFQYLKDQGYAFLIAGFHVKGQVIDARGVSAWGYGGQTMQRGDWHGAQAVDQSRRPRQRLEETGRAAPSTSCQVRRATIRSPTCRIAASTGSITSWPHANCSSIDPANTYLVVEHEYPRARIQDRARLAPILAGSLAFTRAIDEAAAAMYALQHEVLASQGIPTQGVGREAYRS